MRAPVVTSQPAPPGIPATPAQQERYDRVIAAAADALSAGGLEAVQMRDLAQRAGVSLATLYRYFPSKEYVLLAVSLARYQEAARKVLAEVPQGDSVRERVATHFIREFRAQRRDPRLTEGLTQAMRATARTYAAMLESIEHVHQQILRHVAGGGTKLSEQQLLVLPVVTDIFSAATQRWLAGKCSVEEAKFEIEAGCELLEIPDEIVSLARKQAAPEVGPITP